MIEMNSLCAKMCGLYFYSSTPFIHIHNIRQINVKTVNDCIQSWIKLREVSHLVLLQEVLSTCSVHDLMQEDPVSI